MNHYELNVQGIEIQAIDIIKAKLTPDQLKGFAIGNIIKYITRAGVKPDNTELADMKKARWYLDYLIREIESNGL